MLELKEASAEIDKSLNEKMKEYENDINETTKAISTAREDLINARSQGDLSENAEYRSAVETLKNLNTKLQTLTQKVDAYRNYHTAIAEGYLVSLGSTVKIRCTTNENVYIIKIVPEGVGVPETGAVSIDTALCKQLINEQVGSVVDVMTNSGLYTYEILEVI